MSIFFGTTYKSWQRSEKNVIAELQTHVLIYNI